MTKICPANKQQYISLTIPTSELLALMATRFFFYLLGRKGSTGCNMLGSEPDVHQNKQSPEVT
jgi:hypothetical protein